MNHKEYFQNEYIKLDGFCSRNGDKFIVNLQLTCATGNPNAFNFICRTICECESCAWRRADKKALAFLKSIEVKE